MLPSNDTYFSLPDGISVPMTPKDVSFIREICLELFLENERLWDQLLQEALSRYSLSEVVFNMDYSKFPVKMTVVPVCEAQKSVREATVAWTSPTSQSAHQSRKGAMMVRVVVQRGNGLQTTSFDIIARD